MLRRSLQISGLVVLLAAVTVAAAGVTVTEPTCRPCNTPYWLKLVMSALATWPAGFTELLSTSTHWPLMSL